MTGSVNIPAEQLRAELKRLGALSAPALIANLRDQEFWFDNLVQNGGFDSDTVWTKGTNWSISGGVAVKAPTTAGSISAPASGLKAGRTFRISFDLVRSNASFRVQFLGGTIVDGTDVSTSATHVEHLTAVSGNNALNIYGATNSDGTVDNVTLYESDGTNIVHRLPTGWKPHRVFVDGMLQREGAADDYEVAYDGFDYFVKPTVAPSVTTQTCVIGAKA